jgi:hypothetical protein
LVPLPGFSPPSGLCNSEVVRRGSVYVDKGKTVLSTETNGCIEGDMERSNSVGDGTSPCLDLEVFTGVEPIPLNSCPPLEYEKSTGINSSTWVLQKVKEIRQHVGISYEGFEAEFMALLTAIEASHYKE